MIEKRTVLKSAGFEGQHSMYITLSMQLVENGNVISESNPHRTCIDGGKVSADLFIECVNTHLAEQFSYPPISESDAERIKAIYALVPPAPENQQQGD